MNVSLTPQLEKFVAQKVKSGMYTSASEVVRESLRLLEQQTSERQAKFEALKKDIQQSVKAVKEGKVTRMDQKMIDRIKAKTRAEQAHDRRAA